MRSDEIRSLFLDHYASGHGHVAVPSASLVPSSYDPSVLLTTAGMQPFKPYFAGTERPPSTRMTSCQKCFRTPDIDEVGSTARHMTFFEMLGNFSFGDYFKQGAVEMAWELVTERLGIDPARLWATVHEGDEELGLGLDEEARELWIGVGLPAERIVPLGADNFWKAGPTGPCGPCSEIYFDRGEEWGCGEAQCRPGCECDRFLEFYNLVFMQYTRDDAGALHELPQKNIDTGMGLERISSMLQGNVSVFEIDSVRPILDWATGASGRPYGDDADPEATKAIRVLVDHGRGMSFLASDGVTPANEGRGYVLRRVIRRAIQQADRIGLYEDGATGVLAQLHALVVDGFGATYPELVEHRDTVAELLAVEEERFLRTLESGSERLGRALDEAAADGATVLAGDEAFRLHDTYGFPYELTEELAAERELTVDRVRFDELMREQRERARAAAGSGSVPVEEAAALAREGYRTRFLGHERLALDAQVLAVRELAPDDDGTSRVLLKLSESPFYAEGGGQVSDAGTISGPDGLAHVEHVLRFEEDQVVVAKVVDGTIREDDTVHAEVDVEHRLPAQANHTATHLLHKALRQHLGSHVRQAGSLVEPGRLRFDFTHPEALTGEQLEAIERTVNLHVAAAEPVTWHELDIEEAERRGAMMLFGEKYGDRVRMVEIGGDVSRELCGGTHVRSTSEIRDFLIVGESSVGSGTRRIEALTGEGALRHLRRRARAAEAAAAAAGTDVERLPERVAELTRSARELERELSSLRAGGAVDDAVGAAREVGPVQVVAHRDDALAGDELLELADRLRGRLGDAAVAVLGSAAGDKVGLVVACGPDAIAAGVRAGDVVGRAAKAVGGGGGGKPSMARAGGRDVARLDEALEEAVRAVEDAVGAAAGA